MRRARPAALGALLLLVPGCACRLSGTPLDVMEKRLNPACWSWCRDDQPSPPAPTPDATTDATAGS